MTLPAYASSVFVNCPFTADYNPMFRAIIFAVIDCGFSPRCAREDIDSGDIRLQKIERIIEGCKFGIHDLSNMEIDPSSGLPRFNMPFELGLFLGAKRYGHEQQKDKRLIIMDSEPYRYQQAMSDISGQDVEAHSDDPAQAIRIVRDWLKTVSRRTSIPGAAHIIERYSNYQSDFPNICNALKYDADKLPYNDLCETMVAWQQVNVD